MGLMTGQGHSVPVYRHVKEILEYALFWPQNQGGGEIGPLGLKQKAVFVSRCRGVPERSGGWPTVTLAVSLIISCLIVKLLLRLLLCVMYMVAHDIALTARTAGTFLKTAGFGRETSKAASLLLSPVMSRPCSSSKASFWPL